MAVDPQPLEGVADQEDIVVVVTMTTVGDISADTFSAVLVAEDGTVVTTKTLGSGITVTNNGGASTFGVLEVVFTAANLNAAFADDADRIAGQPTAAKYEVWRTNSGRHARIAFGDVDLDSQNVF